MQPITITDHAVRIDSNSLNTYLKEISKENLLTSEEEVALVKQIKKGDQAAKDRLVKANLRFVVSIARQYQHGPVPVIDLINEGNIGLISAAERFDESRGFKFISYAVWWIRQSILKALNEQSRIIKIPTYQLSNVSKIMKMKEGWTKTNDRCPTHAELAEIMSLNESELSETLSTINPVLSLDTTVNEEAENSILNQIADVDGDESMKRADYLEQLKRDVGQVLSRLGNQEKEIIKMTFGIDYPSTLSLREMSVKLNISKERIRQIKEKTLKKLSFHAVRKKLKRLTIA